MEQSLPSFSQTTQPPKFGAGFGIRLAAQVVDLIVHNLLSLVVGLVTGILIGLYALVSGSPSASLVNKVQGTTLPSFVLVLLGYVMYHTVCEGMHGATLGKLIFRIHVLNEDGTPATIVPAFIRSLAFNIDQLFLGIVAAQSMRSSELKQRLGDKWAKTVVVERTPINQYPWPSGWKFVIALLLAFAADGVLIALSLLIRLV